MILAPLSPATGPLLAAAALLALAGVAKVRRPAPTGLALARLGLPGSDPVVRVLGGLELVVAGAAALVGGWAAAPVALFYLGFASISTVQVLRAAKTGEVADCGCFGDRSAPVGWTHVAVNLGLAAVAVVAVGTSADGVVQGLADAPAATVLVVGLAVVAEAGLRALLTDLPVLRALRGTDEAAA